MSVTGVLLGVVLPLGLMATLVPPAIRQLRGPTHPLRLLTEALTAGFVLLVCAVLISMPGWVQVLWWAALAVVLVAAVVTAGRTLRGPDVDGLPARPAERPGPVSRRELALSGLLWALMTTAVLFGG